MGGRSPWQKRIGAEAPPMAGGGRLLNAGRPQGATPDGDQTRHPPLHRPAMAGDMGAGSGAKQEQESRIPEPLVAIDTFHGDAVFCRAGSHSAALGVGGHGAAGIQTMDGRLTEQGTTEAGGRPSLRLVDSPEGARTLNRAAAGRCAPFGGDFAALKERQLVFLLARQLAEAQFVRADRRASERLWQEVAALDIDPERITALLYGAEDLEDTACMERIDAASRLAAQAGRRGWLRRFGMGGLRGGRRGGAHRSAAPADLPARRPAD